MDRDGGTARTGRAAGGIAAAAGIPGGVARRRRRRRARGERRRGIQRRRETLPMGRVRRPSRDDRPRTQTIASRRSTWHSTWQSFAVPRHPDDPDAVGGIRRRGAALAILVRSRDAGRVRRRGQLDGSE